MNLSYYYSDDPRVRDFLVSVINRCYSNSHCEHAVEGKVPLFVMTSIDAIACEKCLPRYKNKLLYAQKLIRNGQDTNCDFCQEPKEAFRTVQIPYGPCTVGGEMCDDCFEQWIPEQSPSVNIDIGARYLNHGRRTDSLSPLEKTTESEETAI